MEKSGVEQGQISRQNSKHIPKLTKLPTLTEKQKPIKTQQKSETIFFLPLILLQAPISLKVRSFLPSY